MAFYKSLVCTKYLDVALPIHDDDNLRRRVETIIARLLIGREGSGKGRTSGGWFATCRASLCSVSAASRTIPCNMLFSGEEG